MGGNRPPYARSRVHHEQTINNVQKNDLTRLPLFPFVYESPFASNLIRDFDRTTRWVFRINSSLPGQLIRIPFSLSSPRRGPTEPLTVEHKKNILTYIIEPRKPLLDTYKKHEEAVDTVFPSSPCGQALPVHTVPQCSLFALSLCYIDPTPFPPMAASSKFSEVVYGTGVVPALEDKFQAFASCDSDRPEKGGNTMPSCFSTDLESESKSLSQQTIILNLGKMSP
ncbi:hypothetical protein WISP_12245 [Willisornis vidua]|uniref:Uncharacterized protein n=1 Tax=Willisornis vidua TaxID=1566151 RepID=A0ABQ9DQX7_9PASS|nr:hypothetical protein WISP_12245 [Willisornis vidua]